MPRLIIAAILLAVLSLPLLHEPSRAEPAPDLVAPAVANEVIVQLKPAFQALPDAALEARLGAEVVDRLPELRSLRLRLEGGETPAEAVERLVRLPYVELVEPNHLIKQASIPNDPLFSIQSGYLDTIDAPEAWDIEIGSDAVLVSVLDSGIDLEHPDLVNRIWVNPLEAEDEQDDDANGCVDDLHGCSFVSRSSVDSSCPEPQPSTVTDDNGHGTFVSGIIAAEGNNGLGISGAAPGVTIVPVKILDCRGGGTAVEAAQGILYAARIGARVANISFGADGDSLTLANAIREAYNRYGMVIIAATGNEGSSRVTFPARLPQTIAVASSGTASDPNGRSVFSDWGPEVSFAAPGLNIISTVPEAYCDRGWACVDGLPYAVSSGTSFAAPLASALAALLISRTPYLSPEEVRQIIAQTAEPLPDGSTAHWDGAGRIRMQQALRQPRYFLGAPGIGRH